MKILDAAGSVFFQKELEQIKARAYDVLYPELSYDKAFDVSTEINYVPEKVSHLTTSMMSMGAIAIDANGIYEVLDNN